MRSVAGAFPDARLLLALDSDQLAGLFLFIFRSSPWRNPQAVRRCVQHWANAYPPEMRGAVVDALMDVWTRLSTEGFLGDAEEASTFEIAPAQSRAIRLRA